MRERVEVARLDRELLEPLGERAVGALAADDLARDARRVLVAPDLGEALERAAQLRRCAPRSCLASNHHSTSLRGDDALPAEPVAELDVGRRGRPRRPVGELGERRERLVAAVELVGEDLGELAASATLDLGLVGLDLDALREQLGDLVPLLDLLAEVAQARQRVEVLEVGLADDVERADGVLRVVELLVEARQAAGDLAALGRRRRRA